MPWFINAFVCEQFHLQTEAFGKNLFWLVNPALGDEQGHDQLSHTNKKVSVVSRVMEHIEFMNGLPLFSTSELYPQPFHILILRQGLI